MHIYIYIYTSGQRYGITTTKWNLREFDRHLLFLVVCSIAERNTVDFVDLLHNLIDWPNTVSIVWGPLRLKRRIKVSSGVVTWSEVCLAITTLMLLSSWGFSKGYWYVFKLLKGIMPHNLPEQILQRIVTLSADGNSKREVARMLVSGKTVNCSEWSEQTASSRLLVCECRWSADLGGGCQFEPFRDGFWPPDIGLGVHPDVLGSLWSTGDSSPYTCTTVTIGSGAP